LENQGIYGQWEATQYGKLGYGGLLVKNIPIMVKVGSKFKMADAGSVHSTAIDASGNLWTWGYNKNGRLGDGTTSDRYFPILIKPDTKFNNVSAGYAHTLTIDESGKLWVWGYNDSGQLGDGTAWHESPVWINNGNSFRGKLSLNR